MVTPVSITFDSLSVESRFAALWNPSEFELQPRSHWLGVVKRMAETQGLPAVDRLFLYRHRTTGRYVLALWERKPGPAHPGLFTPLEGWEGSPDHAKSGCPSMDFLTQRLLPADEMKKTLRNQMNEAASQLRCAESESEVQYKAAVKFWKRKDADYARALESGEIPFAGHALGGQSNALDGFGT